MSRFTRARIHLDALRHNLAVARSHVGEAKVAAVIKAGGYGHGAVAVAGALAGADAFAVTSVDEAEVLRQAGFHQRILVLDGLFEADELELAAARGLDLVVHSDWQLDLIERFTTETPLRCWLKVDSGMHRLGYAPERVKMAYARLANSASVEGPVNLMTHFACADDRRSDYTRSQLQVFNADCEELPGERSAANSAGVLAWPESHYEWVRPGVMLYGASPFADELPGRPALEPAMTLESRLIAIQHFRRGDRVGYAGTFTCPEDMPVGVVAIRYDDGYPRHAPSGTPVLVDGRRTALVGRVAMDL